MSGCSTETASNVRRKIDGMHIPTAILLERGQHECRRCSGRCTGFDDDVRLRGPHGCVQGLSIELTHRGAYAVESAGPVPTFVQTRKCTRLFDESLDLFDLDSEQFRQPVLLLVPDQIFREVLFSGLSGFPKDIWLDAMT